ncbi:hypothetical protein KKF61_08730 [Patescibacteria group bacterium]|nr:hypothetical protein [Patescibacteria group bacterium]
MSRKERYGTRDLTYSAWHRLLDDSLTYIDIDDVEYCQRCRQSLALIETAQDVGQPFKATIVTRRLAQRAQVPAFLVFYRKADMGLIDQFRIRQIYPTYSQQDQIIAPPDYAALLMKLRTNHHCNGVPTNA